MNVRLENSQVGVCPAIESEGNRLLENNLSNEFLPGLLVQDRSVNIVDTQTVVALDSLPGDIDVGIRLVNAVISLKEA